MRAPVPWGKVQYINWYGNTSYAFKNRDLLYRQLQGYHSGLDFVVPLNTPITNTANRLGTVLSLDNKPYDYGAGPCNVLVDFQDYLVLYGHTSCDDAKKPKLGATFNSGDVVALSGTDGNVPHLHMEVIQRDPSWDSLPADKKAKTRPGNTRLNPVAFLGPSVVTAMKAKAWDSFHRLSDTDSRYLSPEDQPSITPCGPYIDPPVVAHPCAPTPVAASDVESILPEVTIVARAQPSPSPGLPMPVQSPVVNQGKWHAFDPMELDYSQSIDWCNGHTGVGVAVDGHGIVFTLNGGHCLRKLSPTGKELARWNLKDAGLAPDGSPGKIVLDRAGNVYLADWSNDRIDELSPAGTLLAQWGQDNSLTAPRGVAVDDQGNIYIANSGENAVLKLAPTGKVLGNWGRHTNSPIAKTGIGPGEFNDPEDIALDSAGNIYVADTGNDRIQKLSPLGLPLAQWGEDGTAPGQFHHPDGIAVDSQGNIFVGDSGNKRLQELAPDGQPLALWTKMDNGGGPIDIDELTGLASIAVDGDGNVYLPLESGFEKLTLR